jgi:hypothetical protein
MDSHGHLFSSTSLIANRLQCIMRMDGGKFYPASGVATNKHSISAQVARVISLIQGKWRGEIHSFPGKVVRTTPARMTAAAQMVCRPSGSSNRSRPSKTAITGFT